MPVLVDGDFVLTQNAAILGYIADTYPDAKLAGDGSARQRAEAARWLAYANADLHPAFHPLFGPARFLAETSQHEAVKQAARIRLRGIFERAEQQLDGRQWIAGFRSFADPYLYITLRWAQKTHVDLAGFDNLAAFKRAWTRTAACGRIAGRRPRLSRVARNEKRPLNAAFFSIRSRSALVDRHVLRGLPARCSSRSGG